MKRQQFVDGPAMIRDASGHRRCGPATGGGQTRMWRAKIIDGPDEIHTVLQRQRTARQCTPAACQRGQPLTERGVEPVTVGRRIAPPTAASERRVRLSPHAAPQYPDACHADLAGDSLLAPAFSHRGNVHAALAGSQSANHGGDH